MNCCLRSGIPEHSPNSRVRVEVFHFVLGSSISLSHNRLDFVHERHDCRGCVKKKCGHFLVSALGYENSEILEAASFPALFCMQQAHLLLHSRERSRIQIQRIPIIPDSPLLRQVSTRCHPSTGQGKHLSASIENSALRQASNFFSSCLPVSLEL